MHFIQPPMAFVGAVALVDHLEVCPESPDRPFECGRVGEIEADVVRFQDRRTHAGFGEAVVSKVGVHPAAEHLVDIRAGLTMADNNKSHFADRQSQIILSVIRSAIKTPKKSSEVAGRHPAIAAGCASDAFPYQMEKVDLTDKIGQNARIARDRSGMGGRRLL
jgi:hypothetical protein